MERMRRDCSVGSDYRAVGARISWLLAAVATTSCAAPRSTPAPTARVETAPSIAELEASLRRDAAAERDEDPVNGPVTPVRVVSFANILGDATDRVTTAPSTIQGDPRDALAEAARRRVDLAIAPISVTTSGGSISREATRGYLAGRTAIADGRPLEAIEPLRESVRRGGGVAAIRALADAYDRTGRSTEATDARRELARRGALEPDDRVRLVDALVRRRAVEDALAVQAVGVIRSLDEDRANAATFESIRFAELLELAGRDDEARWTRMIVDAWIADSPDMGALRRAEDAPRLRRLLIEVGDDAARTGDLRRAEDRWARAASLDVASDAGLRSRRLVAACAMGRDLGVQTLLLEAADAPTAEDLAMAVQLRMVEPTIDLQRVGEILEARALAEAGVGGSLRMLVALDPLRGGAMLERLAAEDRGAVAGPLVTAAYAGGASSAVDVARSIVGSVDGMDAAVEALLAGPADDRTLLTAMLEAPATGSPVLAEVWRRHERPDLAAEALASADELDAVVRVARLRLLADLAEPTLVLAVPESPFDVDVEVARIHALLASGEPELARERARLLLDRLPDDPAVLAVMARVESTRRGGEIEAVEIAARARRSGDRSLATMLDLAGYATQISDGEALSISARRTLAELADDPAFRAILEADAAIAAGDPTTAITRLEPRIGDPEAREAVLMRLLAAWRAAGRLAEGRMRIARLCREHPADPVLSDALFAIDRAIDGPRAVAIELRPTVARSISGQPRRRLELVLAEIPESEEESRRTSLERLVRRPDGPAAEIQRLALLLDAEDAELRQAAIDSVGRLEPAALTPRLRRRLASVAAAVPDDGGTRLVARIAENLRPGDWIDVDTAIALAVCLDPILAEARLGELRAGPVWTRLDPTWRARVAGLASRDRRAAGLVAALAISTPPSNEDDAGMLRTAIAVSALAGSDASRLLDQLDQATAIGWSPVEAWPDGRPDDLQRLAAIASDATMLGREDLSLELMERAVDARPDDPVLLNNLGYALLETGRIDEATPLLERSRELDPESASTLDSIGCLRFLQGRHDVDDPESAISLIRRSVSVRIGEGRAPSAEVLLHLADASWAAGDRATAEDIWRRIAAPIDPADRQRRLAGIRSYQLEVWGGELVPSESIDDLLEGRWSVLAQSRLDAIRQGRSPIEFPGVIPPPDA